MLNQMKSGSPEFPADCISDGARDLLSRMLRPRPSDRICVRGVMAHPWYQEGLPEMLQGDKAIEYNNQYLAAEMPAGRMGPDEARRVMEQAAQQVQAARAAGGESGSSGGAGESYMLDDRFIDEVIAEDAHEHDHAGYGTAAAGYAAAGDSGSGGADAASGRSGPRSVDMGQTLSPPPPS